MKKIILIIILIVLFNSCWKVVQVPYGKEFNKTRKNVGLRIIDSTFIAKKIVEQDIKKSPIKRNLKDLPVFISEVNSPTYIGKTIHLNENNGKIIYEEDLFISGVNKAGVDINIVESLTLRYTFKDFNYSFKKPSRLGGDIKETHIKGWKYVFTYPKLLGLSSNHPETIYYEQKEKIITKKETDSILKSWKLERLNY